ncbi:ATP-binding protein [Roseomonas sp. BU-1]|uniref:ATP-binding protein n=1 Tax=Falsiroseomonas selenitidurans TaxID=2716335 RepID=A0ABX1E710_9PROT|nr:ATP-binding protein [Falsiroseomonas selenitidurans]
MHSPGISYLAGGNNSGKSTLLQAVAVWDFCRSVLENERGIKSLLTGYGGQGLGLADDEFSPIALASLKHLWTNLKSQIPDDGYSLSVECRWLNPNKEERHLRLALALTNDRLFIKPTASNLTASDALPSVAYLPPFAGITSRENKMSGAERRAMIGRGLAGGIIRNLLHDMHQDNLSERDKLKIGRSKIKNSDLARLRQSDPWEILQTALSTNFNLQLNVEPFNDIFHTYIKVSCTKVTLDDNKIKRIPAYNSRDLMAEGSGFLQWLSVYVLALSPSNSTLLLDEPDAHLHPALQARLVETLEDIAQKNGKQILLATHSTEILRTAEHAKILQFRGGTAKYLNRDTQKIDLFIGLGSDYAPKIDPLRRHKKMLIVEAESDARLLTIWAEKLGVKWPQNVIIWPYTASNKDRKQLFIQLKAEIPDLVAVSLRDRDDESPNSVDKETLRDKSINSPQDSIYFRVWRRRHIENYLLSPTAIARAAGCSVAAVEKFMAEHGLFVPENFTSRDVAASMLDARGKEIMQESERSIKHVFDISSTDIARNMERQEIPEDVIVFINLVSSICEGKLPPGPTQGNKSIVSLAPLPGHELL